MSKYNRYAKELNQAFKAASDQYNEAYRKWKDAEAAKEKGVDGEREIFPGFLESKKKELEIDAINAKAEFQNVQKTVWSDFNRTKDRLTRELQQEVKKDGLTNPDDVDDATMAILNSGIVKGDDLEALADKFSENSTMSRMIGQKAGELAENEKDSAEKTRLSAVEYRCKNAKPKVLEDWDKLSGVADHYSGKVRRVNDPDYIMKITDHWSDQNVQTAIENF